MTEHSCDAFGAVVDPDGSARVCMRCRRVWVKGTPPPSRAAIGVYEQMAAAAREHADAMWRDDYQETP